MLAGKSPSGKKRHPVDSRSLLIFILAEASFGDIAFIIENKEKMVKALMRFTFLYLSFTEK